MQKTAIVCVTNDLTTDQRVHKTCLTLQKCGYWVIAAGRLLPESMLLERSYFTLRRKLWFHRGPLFYAEFNIRFFSYLLTADVDLIYANDLDTLPAAYFAAKLRHKKLIYDTHELFTEVPELKDRPIVRMIWQKIENYFLPRLNQTITVCNSIAEYYNKRYGIRMKVVRNMPLYRPKTKNNQIFYSGKKIILYQGAINIGRGLDWVIEAMPLIENAVLLIIGDGDIKMKLESQVKDLKLEDKVKFIGKIPVEKLYEYTSSADIGLCLLEDKGLNYYYSLPNRIFDFIQAEVPVLATRFPEIAQVVEKYKSGVLIDHYEPSFLAETIHKMLNFPIGKEHFETAAKELCWENEEKMLISVINDQ
jgi:glycosyltransferase involved in cell wall biosynthesis